MPAPQSQIVLFFDLVRATQAMKGIKFLLGARALAAEGSPPRIVMFPVEGPVSVAQDNVSAIRDVDLVFAVRCWGKDFDEADDLLQRFCQGLVEQAVADVSFFFKTQTETWNTDPDTNRQGEEVELLIVVTQSVDRTTQAKGEIDDQSLTRE